MIPSSLCWLTGCGDTSAYINRVCCPLILLLDCEILVIALNRYLDVVLGLDSIKTTMGRFTTRVLGKSVIVSLLGRDMLGAYMSTVEHGVKTNVLVYDYRYETLQPYRTDAAGKTMLPKNGLG